MKTWTRVLAAECVSVSECALLQETFSRRF